MTTLDELPSPPRIATAAEFWLRPERFLERCAPLGDRFQLPLPGLPPSLAITSPKDVREVFTGEGTALRFGEGSSKMAPVELLLGPTSIAVKDGEPHLRDRHMLNPFFTGARLKAYVPTMTDKTREALRGWPLGRETAFHPLMMNLTLDVIVSVVFGVSETERAARARQAVLGLLECIGSPRFLFTTMLGVARGGRWDGRHTRLRAAMARVDAVVLEEVALRRAEQRFEHDDLLSVFLGLQREEGEAAMSDRAICEAMRTMLIGGYETTATSLAWLAERIVRHADVLEALEASVDRGDDAYLEAVIAESLRLRTVAPQSMRFVAEPFELGDLCLEPGSMIQIMIALVHRRPDVYPDPLAFRPERFVERKPKNFEWIPFGGGVRKCLGGPFALLEMKVVLRTILQELRFEPTREPDEPIARRSVMWAPARGARVTLRRR